MEHSIIFARHFAHLVWLLLHEPTNTDEQKVALRALVMLAKDGAVNLSLYSDSLQINGEVVPLALTGVTDVGKQMKSHGLAMISVDANAAAAHLLGVARILVGMPALDDDGGAAAEAQRIALGATSVRFAAKPRISLVLAMPEMEFGDVLDDPLAEARAKATPRSMPSIPTPVNSHDAGGLFAQFAAPRPPTESYEVLLKKLDVANDPPGISNVLDDLVVLAEIAARERRSAVVSDIMTRMLRRETSVMHPESKRIVALSLRRLSKAEPLRSIASQLAVHPARRDEYVAILAKAGEQGADALIEQISAVAQQRDRHVYFGALVQLKAGVTSLLHMLSDPQWFVVRNAAEMLGEMQVRDAEKPLTDLLEHDDDRVRRAVTGALMRLGTVRAMQAIQAGLSSSAPDTRSEAAAALVTRKDGRSTATLLQALDGEKDEQVQASFLLALGKLGTPEAIQRLIKGAEADRGLFKRKTTSYRLASVRGLSEARALEATDALLALQSDKDADVREAAKQAISRITRRSTLERPALS
ncbi:MAG: HEAT repeat domain-containing protein [bacterium]